jgi:hypothetical protein
MLDVIKPEERKRREKASSLSQLGNQDSRVIPIAYRHLMDT